MRMNTVSQLQNLINDYQVKLTQELVKNPERCEHCITKEFIETNKTSLMTKMHSICGENPEELDAVLSEYVPAMRCLSMLASGIAQASVELYPQLLED